MNVAAVAGVGQTLKQEGMNMKYANLDKVQALSLELKVREASLS